MLALAVLAGCTDTSKRDSVPDTGYSDPSGCQLFALFGPIVECEEAEWSISLGATCHVTDAELIVANTGAETPSHRIEMPHPVPPTREFDAERDQDTFGTHSSSELWAVPGLRLEVVDDPSEVQLGASTAFSCDLLPWLTFAMRATLESSENVETCASWGHDPSSRGLGFNFGQCTGP